jgi:lipopolysaccharide biosynthesis glycosyltransferase
MSITVCFATNDNYAPHAAALVVSIMVNKLPEDELTFYCFSDKLSAGVCRLFRQLEQQWKFTLHFIDIDASILQPLPDFHGNRTTYSRLIMARLLPDSLEKILYLDCDMIVTSSLSELFATDIEGKYAAVVIEAVSMPHLASLNLQHPYFNAGMLLFNLKQYRQDQMEEKAFDFAEKHRKMLLFADQDIFNPIFGNHVVYVPIKWNCIQHHRITFFPKVSRCILQRVGWKFPEGFWNQLREAERQPSIIHFTNTKPWDGGCNSPFAGEYWKYARQTPFYEQVRFSWRRIWRNILNFLLLGTWPIVYHLITNCRKK